MGVTAPVCHRETLPGLTPITASSWAAVMGSAETMARISAGVMLRSANQPAQGGRMRDPLATFWHLWPQEMSGNSGGTDTRPSCTRI